MSKPHRLLARLAASVVVGVGLLWGAASTPVRADAFVDGFEDLPLMPGLANVPAASVSFDAAAGRIVVAFAEGKVRMPDVRAFYAETLPQLGWSVDQAGRWMREGEVLTVDTVVEGDGLVVRFELTPR
ncbi:hypothetical protein BAL199_10175 [alpha proteobacterium BAL199]|jgi:hypothetical protein|nr:hypothetical protein BAL199_10175 [alpha proteobacterium BAL199]